MAQFGPWTKAYGELIEDTIQELAQAEKRLPNTIAARTTVVLELEGNYEVGKGVRFSGKLYTQAPVPVGAVPVGGEVGGGYESKSKAHSDGRLRVETEVWFRSPPAKTDAKT